MDAYEKKQKEMSGRVDQPVTAAVPQALPKAAAESKEPVEPKPKD